MNILLLTPRRRFIANRFGLGYQIPLGLVLLGGPLIDAGHRVRLLDNDAQGWDDAHLVEQLAADLPDAILIGHTGSTAAHPVAMETAHHLRQAFPSVSIIYGGVYPTYAAQAVMRANPAIDVIVHGEGEATMVELITAMECDPHNLCAVKGITWRERGQVVTNPVRPPIHNLDEYRPGWELVDWEKYTLFGFGRAAGMQFSRGCTLHCSYCGQWSFWRQWRHRSPQNVADQMEILVRRYGVRIVWLADEHFAADRELARQVLEAIAERKLGLSINLNMTAASVVRDADLLPLYKRAGVDNIIMGIESLDDAAVAKVHKDNPFEISKQAVQLLRQQKIVSLVNIIYGLEEETPATLWQTLRRLFTLDADIVNACYITPHFWTQAGRQTQPAQVIEPDQSKWTYRNQVVATPHLSRWQLLLGVKTSETLFHLRPRALWRMVTGGDARYRQIMRGYLATGARVVLAELGEFGMSSISLQLPLRLADRSVSTFEGRVLR